MEIKKMDSSASSTIVKLVVKASNQQFEDQTIQCEPTWSIKKLKEHLYEVYPCKPTLDEQKLIYSGQLLTDKIILKDILRHYDGQEVHTFHLVYTPKSRPYSMLNNSAGSSSTSTQKSNNNFVTINDGLRHRNVQNSNTTSSTNSADVTPTPSTSTSSSASATTATPLQNIIPQILINNSNAASNCAISGAPGGGGGDPSMLPAYGFQHPTNEYLMAQQLAMQNWMQQAYAQYMNQYMNLLSIGVRPETVFMQSHPAPVIPSLFGGAVNGFVPQMPYLPQNYNFPNSNLMPNLIDNSATQAAAQPPIPAQGQGEHAQPNVQPVQQPQAQPQNQQPQPQPRFPNIVQEELPENRDWLDMFYSLSRLMVLLTLVYFYSSPLRCLVVLFIGLAIYLYHTRYFRPQPAEANNNNNNNNNNIARDQAEPAQNQQNPQAQNNNNNVVQPEQDVQPQQPTPEERPADAAAASTPERGIETTPVLEAPTNNGTSVIAFVRTFVVSFFVSLLPETPAL